VENNYPLTCKYAGTSALKGDITREGQRKLTGMVKDGYNSASRYYLSQLCDGNRQRVIDTVLGLAPPTNEETANGTVTSTPVNSQSSFFM
jgi:hypothetical protein